MTQNEPTPVGDKLPPTESHVETLKRLSELQKRSLKGDQIPFAVNCAFTDFAAIASHIAAKDAEIAKLRAIVDKLPKTADGVTVEPQMRLFTNDYGGGVSECRVCGIWEKRSTSSSPTPVYHSEWYCYSTREAAEAAARKEQP